jgi:hypothetical protein
MPASGDSGDNYRQQQQIAFIEQQRAAARTRNETLVALTTILGMLSTFYYFLFSLMVDARVEKPLLEAKMENKRQDERLEKLEEYVDELRIKK